MTRKVYTNSELKKIAKKYGYELMRGLYCHGQLVFTNGKYVITHDVDQHNGGVWKKSKKYEDLFSKHTRLGTYGENPEKYLHP